MNSQSDQIRALLEEIDELLHGGSNSFLWRFSGDRARHRQTLEHLQGYLTKLQYALKARATQENDLPILLRSNSPNPFAIDDYDEESLEAGSLAPADAVVQDDATELEVRPFGYQDSEGLLDQLGLELAQLRESLLGPLQQEVEQLRQERTALHEEVTQLKIERVKNGPFREELLHQFLDTLVGRLQERMVKQVSRILQEALPKIIASQTAALPPAEMAEVQQLQQRANGLLSNLDSTLHIFSQTLEQNISAYQQSLSVGLERMHSMGREGEVMMSSLVNRLAEQMEQQTELYLKPASTPAVAAVPQMAVSSRGIVSPVNPVRPAQPANRDLSYQHAASPNAVNPSMVSSNAVSPNAVSPMASGSNLASSNLANSTREVVPAQTSVTDDLDNFYADLIGDSEPEVAEKTTEQYKNLEDALFDGIPDGESAWATAWFEGEESDAGETEAGETDTGETGAPASQPQSKAGLTPEAHIIHSLTDLVSRTFNDLEGLNLPAGPDSQPNERQASAQTAVLEPPAMQGAELKKKRTRPARTANPFQGKRKSAKTGDRLTQPALTA